MIFDHLTPTPDSAAWPEWQSRLAAAQGLTTGELGVFLLDAMRTIPSKLGDFCSLVVNSTHHSFALEQLVVSKDILPLPMLSMSAEDVKSLHADHPSGFGKKNCSKWWTSGARGVSSRLTRITAWVTIMVTVVNFLFLGLGHESSEPLEHAGPLGASQVESLHRFYLAADGFVGDDKDVLPGKDWSSIFESKRVGYDGEVVSKAVDLTLEQVLPALPPARIGGSIPAMDIAEGHLRHLLANPSCSIKPLEEWPTKLPKARMRIAPDEWQLLGPELVKRKLVKPILRDKLIYHNGRPLLNGAFGVGKGKFIKSAKTGLEVEILRLIINLVPSNELQVPIAGDVATLPHFGQWHGLELLDNEVLVWDSEDIQCAFYVFSLPDDWLPWFVLDMPLPGSLFGLDDDEPRYLAVCVVPMGWMSAVGVCQAFLRRLVMLSKVPAISELRKDRSMPVEHYMRVMKFHQEYIDNFDTGSVVDRSAYLAGDHDLFR